MLDALPAGHDHPELARFYRLLRAYPERSGKTLRGRLVVLAARALGGDEGAALVAAAALELFQNWVLVHDDIEDDSEERRGQPALHRSVGTPIALNVGDALHVQMWRLLLSMPAAPGVDRDAVLNEFVWMIERTAEGQHLDLAWVEGGRFDVGESDYLEMVTLKTAYYTVVSPLRLGSACAGRPPHPAFLEGGRDLGIAFQIRDDVLNLTPESATGKEFAGDLYEGKRTLILAHFFARASEAERREVETVLALPRERKRPEQIERVLELLARHGALQHAQRQAEARAARGLAALEAAFAGAPDRAAADELLHLLRATARRTS